MSVRAISALLLCSPFMLPASASAKEPARIDWALQQNQAVIVEILEKSSAYEPHHATEQLLLRRVFDIQSDGVSTRVRRVWRLPSASAVQEFGADAIYFDANRDTVRINMAASITPSGTIHWLRPSDAQVVLHDTPAVYTDMHRIDLWYPGLEAGSIAIVDYTVRSEMQGAESIWSGRQLLQNLYPRRELELIAHWSDTTEPQWTDDLDGLECVPQMNQLRCYGQHFAAIENDEGVLWHDVIPEFVISLAPDWQAVVDLAGKRFQEAFGDVENISQSVGPLVEGAQSSDEQIARLHEFVARGIRYVSVSRQGNRITPKSVSKTLESRFGDCKDKSALLIAMLAEVGIKAHPVLVATDRTRLATPELADLHYFDHMVVCLDEQHRCLDPTDSYTGTSVTPPWIQGKLALALLPDATPTTIPANEFRWALDINAQLRFEANGDQVENVVRSFQGEYAGMIRAQLQPLSESARSDWAKQQYHDWVNDSVEPMFTFSGVDELSDVLVIQSETTFPDLIEYVPPVRYTEVPPWLRAEIQSMLLRNRIHASTFPGLRVTAQHEFVLPSEWQIVFAGPNLDFNNEHGLYQRTVRRNGHRVVYESVLELPRRGSISAEDANHINDSLNRLNEHSEIRLIATNINVRQ